MGDGLFRAAVPHKQRLLRLSWMLSFCKLQTPYSNVALTLEFRLHWGWRHSGLAYMFFQPLGSSAPQNPIPHSLRPSATQHNRRGEEEETTQHCSSTAADETTQQRSIRLSPSSPTQQRPTILSPTAASRRRSRYFATSYDGNTDRCGCGWATGFQGGSAAQQRLLRLSWMLSFCKLQHRIVCRFDAGVSPALGMASFRACIYGKWGWKF
nr:hypothetical protein Iba_chr15dCG5440 [Ipomoea batatas]